MWIRVLAETGILGMAFFATWLLYLWWGARTVRMGNHQLHTTAAMAVDLVASLAGQTIL